MTTTMATTQYGKIAADLRQRIKSGEFPVGTPLPTQSDLCDEYGVARATMSAALGQLRGERLVTGVRGQGVFVLDWKPVRVPLSRYHAVLEPGGQLGPWETACQQAGVTGSMVTIEVAQEPADAEVAEALGLQEGTDTVVRRSRHAILDDRACQIHTAYYPARLVEGTPLAGQEKVVGGVYAAMRAAGIIPTSADESLSARPATGEESADLTLAPGAPVLTLDRLTRDQEDRRVEWLRMVIDPTRVAVVFDGLPLSRSGG
ncbi:GntR family transcriptional regulator [Nonomuraea sp. MG754425]|uniref:GntR family transcriptional regulator n=1 Tax=Nonomuraea sp. MG754425 TaxID=2570319 RepID=UPI001F38CB19|nr:GntR family transcriptional regulator [Nonomuraea sp. MG754425]MCF6467421.1 GntR family transcriptional regulator [Nonomuraea sp. MG754425]